MSSEESGSHHQADSDQKSTVLVKVRIAVLVVVAALVLIVVARNWEPVALDFFSKKAELPLSVLVIITFLVGVAGGLLLAFVRPWRKKRK